LIKVWREQVKEQEIDRKIMYEKVLQEQKRREQALMEAHVLGTNLKDKLYKISMEAPDAWRELKRFEYQDLEDEIARKEEEEKRLLEQAKNAPADQEDEELKDLEAEMKFDAAKAATKSILRRDKSGIYNQQEDAAKKIGKTARVKFELDKNKKQEQDSLADEYLTMMNRNSTFFLQRADSFDV
jgi:hypothetical protein